MSLKNGEIIQDYSEFSGTPVQDILEKVNNYRSINVLDFHQKGSPKIFYETSRTYVYDLLSANGSYQAVQDKLNSYIPSFFKLIQLHPGQKFLEFGGGLGVVTEIVKQILNKRHVTYVDVKGHISDFAQWRFKKNNVDIKCEIIPQDTIPISGEYDIIFTDAVFEHLPSDIQLEYAQKLCDLLSDTGLLIFLVDLAGEEPDMPMHYDVDIRQLHAVFENNHLTSYFGRHKFASVWSKGQHQEIQTLLKSSLFKKLRSRLRL